MASISAKAISISASPRISLKGQGANGIFPLKSVSFSGKRRNFSPVRLTVSCAAKPETVAKVCDIVRKQLAVVEGTEINGQTKFSALGADSLDTVEIVMNLEEKFDICVEESSAQAIETVQDAADLIEDLVAAKANVNN
ncbi:Acyl carrier protein (ACP) protein [Dioscorea alata]|uniref:Acyl carrier protein (ACP) protein n=1 Tax=Dioscorea alata TaxID=55571 RepID=A0ACB7VVC1_DIOAL|nr:Acyl carrier protein (ACP) protein [Dioscorea alata]